MAHDAAAAGLRKAVQYQAGLTRQLHSLPRAG
jgi:hypothetical protein